MANTGLPSASGPLDSQGHSLPLLSRSTVLPYSAQSTDLGTIDISSDECEVVKPPKKKLRKTDLSLPRKGKEQAMVRHLPRFFFFFFALTSRGTGCGKDRTNLRDREKGESITVCEKR